MEGVDTMEAMVLVIHTFATLKRGKGVMALRHTFRACGFGRAP